MRDVHLDYLRALSRYTNMSLAEKVNLCELIMYEAMKRFVNGADNENRAKYRMMVAMAEAQETIEAEVGYFQDLYSGLIVV